MESKEQMRERMLRLRRLLTAEQTAEAGVRIAERLTRLPAWRDARCVAGYLPLSGEVPTAALLAALHARGACVALPAWYAAAARYALARWAPGQPLRRGPDGVPEPVDPRWIPEDAVDLVQVPGVAFDAEGRRLGRGGGHYDRMLARCTTAFRVGLAYAAQLTGQVPVDAHDQSVDVVVTESGLFGPRAAGCMAAGSVP